MPAELNKERLKVVHDDDLTALLDRLGILGKVRHGEVRCKFCEEPVTLENLHSLFPLSGAVKLVCDKPACIKGLTEFLETNPELGHAS